MNKNTKEKTMSQFIGTKEEFIKYIGGYCRNKVNSITRTERISRNKTCEHCKKTGVELESAHIAGQERIVIIDGILESNFKIKNNYFDVNLEKFEKLFVSFQTPVNDHFLFLCSDCHRKYDHNCPETLISNTMPTVINQLPQNETLFQKIEPEEKGYHTQSDLVKELYIKYLYKRFPHDTDSTIKFYISTLEKIMSFNNIKNYLNLFFEIDNLIFKFEKNKQKNNYLAILKSFKLFTINNKKNIDDIINTSPSSILDQKTISQKQLEGKQFKNDLKNKYKNWLINHGYKEFTPSGLPSTVRHYIKSIEKIMSREGLVNWTDVATNINLLIKDYDNGGKHEKFGTSNHRKNINALYRFRDLLLEEI